MKPDDMKKLYKEVFGSPNGQLVLADIVHNAVMRRPSFDEHKDPHIELFHAGMHAHAMGILRRVDIRPVDVSAALTGIMPDAFAQKGNDDEPNTSS